MNDKVFTSFVNMNCSEIKKLVEEKKKLLSEKINGKIDEDEKNNKGLLFYNCKLILRNIYMACDKLVFKFKNELTQSEINEYNKISQYIKEDEKNWIDINSVKLTFSKIEDNKMDLSEEDELRIKKNISILKDRNIPYYENMILIPSKSNTKLMNKYDIFERLICDYLLASMATTFPSDIDLNQWNTIYNNLNLMYSFEQYISDENKHILEKIKNNDLVDKMKLSWLYERCAIYMWILGLWKFPSQQYECDVNLMNEFLFFNKNNEDSFPNLFLQLFNHEKKSLDLDNLKMISYEEILEKADLLNRYKWAYDDAIINNKKTNFDFSNSIVANQLYAFYEILNWDPNTPVNNNYVFTYSNDKKNIQDSQLNFNKQNGDTNDIKEYAIFSRDYLDFKISLPKSWGEIKKLNEKVFLIKGHLTILLGNRCNNASKLEEITQKWIEFSSKKNGQEILKDSDRTYYLNNGSIKVLEKNVIKENKRRQYKCVYFEGIIVILGYDYNGYNQENEDIMNNAIISMKKIDSKKVEREPFKEISQDNNINDRFKSNFKLVSENKKENTIIVSTNIKIKVKDIELSKNCKFEILNTLENKKRIISFIEKIRINKENYIEKISNAMLKDILFCIRFDYTLGSDKKDNDHFIDNYLIFINNNFIKSYENINDLRNAYQENMYSKCESIDDYSKIVNFKRIFENVDILFNDIYEDNDNLTIWYTYNNIFDEQNPFYLDYEKNN